MVSVSIPVANKTHPSDESVNITNMNTIWMRVMVQGSYKNGEDEHFIQQLNEVRDNGNTHIYCIFT